MEGDLCLVIGQIGKIYQAHRNVHIIGGVGVKIEKLLIIGNPERRSEMAQLLKRKLEELKIIVVVNKNTMNDENLL